MTLASLKNNIRKDVQKLLIIRKSSLYFAPPIISDFFPFVFMNKKILLWQADLHRIQNKQNLLLRQNILPVPAGN